MNVQTVLILRDILVHDNFRSVSIQREEHGDSNISKLLKRYPALQAVSSMYDRWYDMNIIIRYLRPPPAGQNCCNL